MHDIIDWDQANKAYEVDAAAEKVVSALGFPR